MIFYTCGACGIEQGTAQLQLIDQTLVEQLVKSGIPLAYDRLVKPAESQSSNKYDKAFANAAKVELSHSLCRGLLVGAEYVCLCCVKQLPKPAKSLIKSLIPKHFFIDEANEVGSSSSSSAAHYNECTCCLHCHDAYYRYRTILTFHVHMIHK